MIGQYIREKAELMENQRDFLMLQAYYEFIMREENCDLEEAMRICQEDAAA